jgi:hypothetical protein
VSPLFGVVAQAVLGRVTTRRMWLIGAVAWCVGGFVASEVIWGSSTEEERQPIIDGLALDESALGGLIVGVPVVLVTWYLARRRRLLQPMAT